MLAAAWSAAAAAGSASHARPTISGFPYSLQVGDHLVYAERPIAPEIRRILASADQRLAASPIAGPGMGARIFLTKGGDQWKALSKASVSAFAITRPGNEAIIVNASDVRTDRVFNGRKIGGVRPLSQVIAHEMTHGLIRRHLGVAAAARAPAWMVEGYCDYVAGGGSLSDTDAARLIARKIDHPALPYYLGRKRVAAILARNGGSVDRLFASPDRTAANR